MSIGEIIGIIFGPVGIIGIIYTIYYGRKNIKKKLLVYENSDSIPLAWVSSTEDDYRLSVVLERKGMKEERIESVHTTFLRFANLGRESIRGIDIAPSNPLRVEVEGTRTLDIKVAGVTRKVNDIQMDNQVLEDNRASAELNFDFLDYQDGALVKILTVGDEGKISLEGDIIGMPEGIQHIGETVKQKPEGIFNRLFGWIVGIVIMAVLLVPSAFIHYWVIGSWNNVWLILVPLGFLALVILTFILMPQPQLGRRRTFPKNLDFPEWFARMV